jgi:AcrR family transcriptional regulator
VGTRQHIIEAVAKMLAQRPSADIHLADVAERAHVGVQTIYYHFDSRTQLIAEAQAFSYYRLMEPFYEHVTKAEKALQDEDQESFWTAFGDNIVLAWSHVPNEDRWRVMKLLIDISEDSATQREFSDALDVQLGRWIEVFDAAKSRGWIDAEIDTRTLVSSAAAAAVGQALLVRSSHVHFTPESIRDFVIHVAMAKPKRVECPDGGVGPARPTRDDLP